MLRDQWLLLVTFALSSYSAGQVWLVQLSSYPLWALVGPREFRAYHAVWWRSIWGPILVPAGLLIIGATLMLWWRAPGIPAWMTWLGFGLQIILILGTALWWAPLMAHIEEPEGGLLHKRYQLLMLTHWLRVFFVTAYALLVFWMLTRSAWRA